MLTLILCNSMYRNKQPQTQFHDIRSETATDQRLIV